MKPPSLGTGRIVWAHVADPNGQNPKSRPFVVLTAYAEIRQSNRFRAVAVSTRSDIGEANVRVELPWGPGQISGTRLTKWCAAICDWIVELPIEAVQNIGGIVPTKTMNAVLHEIEKFVQNNSTGVNSAEDPPSAAPDPAA